MREAARPLLCTQSSRHPFPREAEVKTQLPGRALQGADFIGGCEGHFMGSVSSLKDSLEHRVFTDHGFFFNVLNEQSHPALLLGLLDYLKRRKRRGRLCLKGLPQALARQAPSPVPGSCLQPRARSPAAETPLTRGRPCVRVCAPGRVWVPWEYACRVWVLCVRVCACGCTFSSAPVSVLASQRQSWSETRHHLSPLLCASPLPPAGKTVRAASSTDA